MSIGGSKESFKKEQDVQKKLDPKSRAGLDFLLGEARGLKETPLVPDLSPETLRQIPEIGTGLGGIDPTSEAGLRATAEGEFLGLDSPFLQEASRFAAESAEGQVSDLFTAGGRTGSPAQAKAVAEGVAGAVAPLAFRQQQLERSNQINAQLGLQQIKSQSDLAIFQGQLAQLEAQGKIDEQERRKLEEPFRRLNLISGPILGAAGLGDITQLSKESGSGTKFGFEADLI